MIKHAWKKPRWPLTWRPSWPPKTKIRVPCEHTAGEHTRSIRGDISCHWLLNWSYRSIESKSTERKLVWSFRIQYLKHTFRVCTTDNISRTLTRNCPMRITSGVQWCSTYPLVQVQLKSINYCSSSKTVKVTLKIIKVLGSGLTFRLFSFNQFCKVHHFNSLKPTTYAETQNCAILCFWLET